MHEQPMLHLRVKPFIVGAKDWSGGVRRVVFSVSGAYWNTAAIHDNYGDPDKLLESDKLALGTM
jgi:hypothetical protein